jgi:hypothetical protein
MDHLIFDGGGGGRIQKKISGKHFELKKTEYRARMNGRKKYRARPSSGIPYIICHSVHFRSTQHMPIVPGGPACRGEHFILHFVV